MRDHTLLIICPAYNEEAFIEPLISQIKKQLNPNDEITVIDDGSTDRTVEVLNKSNVKIISHNKNYGKGMAIRTGLRYFLETKHNYVLFMDGDGQHDPSEIHKFRDCFEKKNAEVVVASRFRTKTWRKNMPFSRKLSNLLSRLGLWALYNGFIVEDPQNGFRGYTRKVAESLIFETNGYEAETEILINAFLKGFNFDVVPIESIYHGHNRNSKFSLLMDTWKIPKVMFKGFFTQKPWLLRDKSRKRY
ncbi:MAG: glycosyltransferase family 2 protein [Candidatus Heimdallarchaeota archaeon]